MKQIKTTWRILIKSNGDINIPIEAIVPKRL